MLRAAVLATSMALSCALSCTLSSDPALAQASPKASPRTVQQPPSDPATLQAWCRQQVFRRYGEPAPGRPGVLQLELEQSVAKTDACVRSKGRTV